MKLYNTKTRQKETFKPLSSREVKIYYCGPTVYNYAHIGNLKTFVFEDIVVKTLRFLGYNVQTTMNITDVDDKTIRDSMAAGEGLLDFTQKYTKIFLDDLTKLGVQHADNVVPVTTLIPEMVRMINTMVRRKNAYLADDGSIYFDVKSFKKYGQLAHLDMSGLQESVRIDNDEYEKENAADFVLWKAWKETDGDNFWEEAFEVNGEEITIKGRPGWHIECSACNMKYFGAQIDIHMGGEDLIFPHHQNEVAQTEACTGKEFSKYWLHSGHITVDGKKMSKSLGNFYTLSDLQGKFSDISESLLFRGIRLSFINGKYRDGVDFSFDKLQQAFNTISKIDESLKTLQRNIDLGENELMGIAKAFREEMQYVISDYIEKLEDDFNIPEALAVFHEFVTFVNKGLADGEFSLGEMNSLKDMFQTFNGVLGIMDFSILEESTEIPSEIQSKFEARNQAKANKDFQTADSLRDELLEAGWKIVDSRGGSRVEKV